MLATHQAGTPVASLSAAPAARLTGRHPLFIGFAAVEAFAASLDPKRAVFVLPVEGRWTTVDQIADRNLSVVCQQVTVEQAVLDRRLDVSGIQHDTEQPTADIWKERRSALSSLLGAVSAYLRGDLGLRVVAATVAAPKDLSFLNATPSFCDYDAGARAFVRKRKPGEPAGATN